MITAHGKMISTVTPLRLTTSQQVEGSRLSSNFPLFSHSCCYTVLLVVNTDFENCKL